MNIEAKAILILLFAISPLTIYAATCNITATPVNFGNYDVASSFPTDTTGSIMVSCNKGLPVHISFTAGSSGNFLHRQMMPLGGGSDRLEYNFFTTASSTTIWGDGTGASSIVTVNVPDKWIPLTLTVYGRIPAGQDVRVGDYADSLTATVTW